MRSGLEKMQKPHTGEQGSLDRRCRGRPSGQQTDVQEAKLEDGCRVGRYVVLRDADGSLYAVTATAVSALCESDDGCLLLIPGGRLIRTSHPLGRMLSWLT